MVPVVSCPSKSSPGPRSRVRRFAFDRCRGAGTRKPFGRSTGPRPIQRRRNTTLRLFAGIAIRSGAANPCRWASTVMSSRSRMPRTGFAPAGRHRTRRCQHRYARRPRGTGRRGRAAHRGDQDARGTGKQPFGGSPGGDMDHVDRDDDICLGDGPGLCCGVKRQRGQYIRQPFSMRPGPDRSAAMSAQATRCKTTRHARLCRSQSPAPAPTAGGNRAAPAESAHDCARRARSWQLGSSEG
jgi:hypothetical protein